MQHSHYSKLLNFSIFLFFNLIFFHKKKNQNKFSESLNIMWTEFWNFLNFKWTFQSFLLNCIDLFDWLFFCNNKHFMYNILYAHHSWYVLLLTIVCLSVHISYKNMKIVCWKTWNLLEIFEMVEKRLLYNFNFEEMFCFVESYWTFNVRFIQFSHIIHYKVCWELLTQNFLLGSSCY